MTKEYFVSNKVYHVKKGEYSDRFIVGIFTTREKAEEYISKVCQEMDWFSINDFDIEEIELNNGCL